MQTKGKHLQQGYCKKNLFNLRFFHDFRNNPRQIMRYLCEK